MKKIFFSSILLIAIVQTSYCQSIHKKKHKKVKTCCEEAIMDTCQGMGSYTTFHSSNEVNRRAEFSTVPLFICPIADDMIAKTLSSAFKGIQITY